MLFEVMTDSFLSYEDITGKNPIEKLIKMIFQGHILKMEPNSVLSYKFVSSIPQNVTGANSHANGRPANLQH